MKVEIVLSFKNRASSKISLQSEDEKKLCKIVKDIEKSFYKRKLYKSTGTDGRSSIYDMSQVQIMELNIKEE